MDSEVRQLRFELELIQTRFRGGKSQGHGGGTSTNWDAVSLGQWYCTGSTTTNPSGKTQGTAILYRHRDTFAAEGGKLRSISEASEASGYTPCNQ